jgi:uncharacterized membrane protein
MNSVGTSEKSRTSYHHDSQDHNWGALIAGSALALLGFSRKSKPGLALAAAGGLLVYKGATTGAAQDTIAKSTVQLNCSLDEAYRYWRNFENLPRFMRHLESVTVNGNRSHWVAVGPMNSRIEWDAEIVGDRENSSISWHTLPGSDLDMDGAVEFLTAPGQRGIIIVASVRYRSAAGSAGAAIAKMMGRDPSFLMRQDLRRFKALIETGEIPTIDGQTHGPRSTTAAAMRMLDPERAVSRGAGFSETLEQQRRIS